MNNIKGWNGNSQKNGERQEETKRAAESQSNGEILRGSSPLVRHLLIITITLSHQSICNQVTQLSRILPFKLIGYKRICQQRTWNSLEIRDFVDHFRIFSQVQFWINQCLWFDWERVCNWSNACKRPMSCLTHDFNWRNWFLLNFPSAGVIEPDDICYRGRIHEFLLSMNT